MLCLADGAGSASHSQYGAQAVVDEGCAVFVEEFVAYAANSDGARVKVDLLGRLTAKLAAVAERHEVSPDDLASTFLCVAASGDTFIGAHVGDGVVGYLKDGTLRVISGPDNSEFANQTTFVTSSRALESMRLFRGSLEEVSGFIIMSDGAGESLFDGRTGQLAGACSKLIGAVAAAPNYQSKSSKYKKRLRRVVNVTIRNATNDDCSIGIFGRILSDHKSS